MLRAATGVLRFCKCSLKLAFVQLTCTTDISMQSNTPGAMSIRWAVRRSAGLRAGTTAGPAAVSCRYLRGIDRQHEERIQRRRSRWEAHIKQVQGPPSCHPMDSEYKSIEIEDLIGLRPVVKLLCPHRHPRGQPRRALRHGQWGGCGYGPLATAIYAH